MAAEIDYNKSYASARSAVLGRNVVSTSQPLAAQAGMRMLLAGGNAVDAAIAAAMTLTVVEPTGNGLGSDAFAIVWDGQSLHGLNSSGRSPAAWTPDRFAGLKTMPEVGWDAVTVPGAVAAWIALSRKFGRLPFAKLAEPAIAYARDGFQVSPIIAKLWQMGVDKLAAQPGFSACFAPDGRAPKAGELFRSDGHAATLEAIADSHGEAFYRGRLADRIIESARQHGGLMNEDDLGQHVADWVQPLSQRFAGAVIHELPPNGQGIATLMALGMLDELGIDGHDVDSVETVHLALEAMKLALADLDAFNADVEHMKLRPEDLISPGYLRERAQLIDRRRASDPMHVQPQPGGTVYIAAADESGMMVSFIQSNYMGFGSGIVVPETGISLQNRGRGFTLRPGHANCVGPRKRPSHTIIPGFATDAAGQGLMAFGVMGGPIQSQGHVQMVLRVLLHGQNPQAAADAPRWRVNDGLNVAVEPSFDPSVVDALRHRGHAISTDEARGVFAFGGAQLILKTEAGYAAGSDPRKDGQAVAA
ncbi:gamma-glutamyltransferase family protein [Tardiphaga sp.]|uniref:gamma-glutamyltransferase family protein n=1 Tax=Tardiphaga sp. TaxID=1926292 RepID=UPI002605B717|nr:gamma-glutamyltransferase family protein [Tardiphaga sp.]MDB5619299.1 gamma-glutamyltransferase 2, Threonine peptidase family [Tardiphaga sp.]